MFKGITTIGIGTTGGCRVCKGVARTGKGITRRSGCARELQRLAKVLQGDRGVQKNYKEIGVCKGIARTGKSNTRRCRVCKGMQGVRICMVCKGLLGVQRCARVCRVCNGRRARVC